MPLAMPSADSADLAALIDARLRNVPDFPKPGVQFKDITPLLDDPVALGRVVAALAAAGRDDTGAVCVEKVVGIEARGFILAAPVALSLGVGFVPVRKPGKLPWQTHQVAYELEYGSERLEMHVDALSAGDRVLIVDDVLATGGTARATAELVERSGGTPVGIAVLLELNALHGREQVGALPVTALRDL